MGIFVAIAGFSAEKIPAEDYLSYCKYGPRLKTIEPTAGPKKHNDAADQCTGSIKVQGVAWECAPPETTLTKNRQLREILTADAKAECEAQCSKRSSGCHGKFVQPSKCGLENNAKDATALGKEFGCRPDCAGPAFVYCSLYDGNYRTDDRELVLRQPSNCDCVLTRN